VAPFFFWTTLYVGQVPKYYAAVHLAIRQQLLVLSVIWKCTLTSGNLNLLRWKLAHRLLLPWGR